VSCPYAHQQNGSAERKHRHVVEVGLTLLAQSSMPLKFWDEAFLTAVFLINRLLSKVIENETPYERLLGAPPDYTFLRSFGCAVWPNLRPYNSKKLEFRSKQCVFLGYSPLHKGFKCLAPKDGRVYISRDVVFDETIFPFAALHPNSEARIRSELALLPDVLKNPSTSSFGDAKLSDQRMLSPAPTNISSSAVDVVDATGTNLAPNVAETGHGEGHFLCSPSGDITGSEEDSPAGDIPSVGASSSGLVSGAPSGGLPPSPPGSSTPATTVSPPLMDATPSSPAHGDPSLGESTAPDPEQIESPGSPVQTPAESHLVPIRPVTRLQRGIRCPKNFTYGTVRWVMSAKGPKEEPVSVDEALGDQRWCDAMDAKYQALLKIRHGILYHVQRAEIS